MCLHIDPLIVTVFACVTLFLLHGFMVLRYFCRGVRLAVNSRELEKSLEKETCSGHKLFLPCIMPLSLRAPERWLIYIAYQSIIRSIANL